MADTLESLLLSCVVENSGGALVCPGPTDRAVTLSTAGRARPIRVLQSLTHILSVPVKGQSCSKQVWSLPQFYSVDFSQSRIARCKKVRFQQTHNQGLRQLLLTVSWDLCAYAPHLTVSLYLCSSASNARGVSRALEGRCVSLKRV